MGVYCICQPYKPHHIGALSSNNKAGCGFCVCSCVCFGSMMSRDLFSELCGYFITSMCQFWLAAFIRSHFGIFLSDELHMR